MSTKPWREKDYNELTQILLDEEKNLHFNILKWEESADRVTAIYDSLCTTGKGSVNTADLANLIDAFNSLYNIVLAKMFIGQLNRSNYHKNEHKAWTTADDKTLLELISDPNLEINDVALSIGRSVHATSQRISHLCGIKRTSKPVDGRFVGTQNGDYIKGRVYNEGSVKA